MICPFCNKINLPSNTPEIERAYYLKERMCLFCLNDLEDARHMQDNGVQYKKRNDACLRVYKRLHPNTKTSCPTKPRRTAI